MSKTPKKEEQEESNKGFYQRQVEIKQQQGESEESAKVNALKRLISLF